MTLLRSLAIISASLLILNSCGGKKEAAPEKPVQEVTENSAEDLFDEFYDSTDASAENRDNTPVEDSYAEEVVEETPVEAVDEIPAPVFSPDGRYVVQISCVASDEIAEDVARKLENSGYPVYVAEVQNPTPTLLGTYYRIRIGGFDNLTTAKSFGENHLMPSGFEYWIDNRSNDNVGIGDFGLGDNSSFDNAASETYESTESYETVSSESATESYESSSESFVAEPIVDEAVSAVEESAPYQEATESVEETATEVTNTVSDVQESVASDDDEWGTSEW